MDKTTKGRFLALGSLVLLAACHTVGVPVPVLRPAEINMSPYKQIAVAEVTGRGGSEVAALLQQALVDSGRFDVVDRRNLGRLLKEQGLAASELSDPNSSVRLGQVLPSSVLIFGREQEDYQEEVTSSEGTCYQGKKKYKCTIYTRSGQVKVKGTFTVSEVETGRVLKTKVIPCENGVQTSATDKKPESIDATPLIEECRLGVVKAFLKAIVPWTETVEAPFQKDSDLPQLKQGIAYARAGNWQQATAVFQEAVRQGESNPEIEPETLARAYFDLALAYEYSGNFAEASRQVEKAYGLDQDETYLGELAEIKRRQAEQKKLEEQLGDEGSS